MIQCQVKKFLTYQHKIEHDKFLKEKTALKIPENLQLTKNRRFL
jgi:hypothetical protein